MLPCTGIFSLIHIDKIYSNKFKQNTWESSRAWKCQVGICSYNSRIIRCLIPMKHWHYALGTVSMCMCAGARVCVGYNFTLCVHKLIIVTLCVRAHTLKVSISFVCVWCWKNVCFAVQVLLLAGTGSSLSIWTATICLKFWLHSLITLNDMMTTLGSKFLCGILKNRDTCSSKCFSPLVFLLNLFALASLKLNSNICREKMLLRVSLPILKLFGVLMTQN